VIEQQFSTELAAQQLIFMPVNYRNSDPVTLLSRNSDPVSFPTSQGTRERVLG
jgi:hypothetical protein